MDPIQRPAPKEINWKLNLAVIWLGQIIAHCAHSFVLPFIQYYMEERFKITDRTTLGLYNQAFDFFGMLTFCVSNPLWGGLGDRFGRKIMLMRAYFLNSLCIPLMLVAPSPVWLVGVRALASCFSGTISAAQALAVSTIPESKHGLALGALSASFWTGTIFGYLCGAYVKNAFGYPAAFLTCGVLLFISGLITLLFAKENFVRPQKKVEPSVRSREPGVLTATIVALLGLLCLQSMARRMETTSLPMLVKIICDSLGGNFSAAKTVYAGRIYALSAIGGLLSGLLIGALSDRCKAWKLALPAFAVAGAMMLFEAHTHSLFTLAAFRFFLFFAAGGIEPVILARLSRSTVPEHRGVVLGWSASVRVIGYLLSAGISALVIASTHENRNVFSVAGIVMLLLIPVSILVLLPKKETR